MGAHGGGGFPWWGQPLIKQSGFYEYGTSPYQQKLFKGFFNPGFYKGASKYANQALFIVPIAAFFYSVAKWGDKKFEYYNRKEYLLSSKSHE